MKQRLDKSKFALFYWGLATENEKQEIFSSKESTQMLEKEWDKIQNSQSDGEVDLQKIKSKIDQTIAKKSDKIIFWQKNFYKYAALFILPLLLGALYYFTSIYNESDKIV